MWAVDLSRPRRGRAARARRVGRVRRARRGRAQRRDPEARAHVAAHRRRRGRDDERQLRLARAHDAGGAAEDARAEVGHDRVGVEHGRPHPDRERVGLQRGEVRDVRLRGGDVPRPRGQRRRHEAGHARPDRHRDLGHPRQRARAASTSRRCPRPSARPASPTRSPTTASSTTCRPSTPAASAPRTSRSARCRTATTTCSGMADMARTARGD